MTDYERGKHDELQTVVKMLEHYIRNDENATLEKACDELSDRLFCMEVMNE